MLSRTIPHLALGVACLWLPVSAHAQPQTPPAVAAPAERPAPTGRVPLDIQAERMELDHRAGRITFEGGIEVTQGETRLTCARLLARYGDDGEIDELVAEGEVRIKQSGLAARAARARWDRAAGTLELTGSPSVERGGDRLSGARVVLWPETGRMVVEQAKGRILAPRLAPASNAPKDAP